MNKYAMKKDAKTAFVLPICTLLVTCFACSRDNPIPVEPAADEFESSLTIVSADGERRFQLEELLSGLETHEVTVYNEAYGKEKTYEGFLLADIFRMASVDYTGGDEIVFTARDGFSPSLDLKLLMEYPNAYLAYKEKGGDFEELREGKIVADPSPFYIIWDDPSVYERFAWPHQVIIIELRKYADNYKDIYPDAENITPNPDIS